MSFDDNLHQVRLCDFHFCCKERWVYEHDLTDETIPKQGHAGRLLWNGLPYDLHVLRENNARSRLHCSSLNRPNRSGRG